MSYDGLNDRDLPLKLRMMNLLWNLGWFVRPNVKIYRYQEGKRTKEPFTDIDVLAIKILPLQNSVIAICSAKSGKESDSSQIFWLAGVKAYFGASFAYYIRSKASLIRAKSLCDRLGIIALNEEQLGIVEARFSLGPEPVDMFSLGVYKQINHYFEELKEKKPSLSKYMTERFWIDPPSSQLLRAITAMRDLKDISMTESGKLFMKYYLSSLFSVSLCSTVNHLIRIPANVVRTELKTRLMGGEMARNEKQRILKACKSFLSEFIKRSRLPEDVAKNGDLFLDRIFRLDYYDDLADLVINMLEHHGQSIYTPRMLDSLSYQIVKKPDSVPKMDFVTVPGLPKEDWMYSAKLTRDVLIFIHRIGCFERSEIDI